MRSLISVVIPNHNGAATIGACLESVYASRGAEFEVIVVDDGSTDASVAVISRAPCRLLRRAHAGAAAARNAGAAAAQGRFLFFTDADCVLSPDTLQQVGAALAAAGPRAVIGGTYAVEPVDPGFLSRFQAVFVNHAETRNPAAPDYVATHAFAMATAEFLASGGFDEQFLPILEDVEFSHRLRRAGFRLVIDPAIQVRHRFGFTLARSLRNAARKTRFWVLYSIGNGDVLAESGTASRGLKANGAAFLLCALLSAAALASGTADPLLPLPLIVGANVALNRGLLGAFRASHGTLFLVGAALYYLLVYPAAVGWGALRGLADQLCAWRSREGRR